MRQGFSRLSLLLVLLFVLSALPVHAAPALSAARAILIDGDTGDVFFEKDADTAAPMASTTKIMTALAVLATLPLDQTVEVPPEAVGVEGTSAYLAAGELLTVKDLLHALLLGSANDAAVTLAIAADGSISAFAERMNRMARELGCTATQFKNPHGLPDEGHYTTARELALLTAYAMRLPAFAEIVARRTYRFRSSLSLHTVTNHNRLLSFSDEAVGVKTGFTKKSGRCLVGAARRDGTLLISVTLNAPNDWRDHMTLWEYGFRQLGIPKQEKRTTTS